MAKKIVYEKDLKEMFSNGCYNKEMIVSHTQIKLPILKWYREEKILHKPRYQSLDSTKNWITMQTRTKLTKHVERRNSYWID